MRLLMKTKRTTRKYFFILHSPLFSSYINERNETKEKEGSTAKVERNELVLFNICIIAFLARFNRFPLSDDEDKRGGRLVHVGIERTAFLREASS